MTGTMLDIGDDSTAEYAIENITATTSTDEVIGSGIVSSGSFWFFNFNSIGEGSEGKTKKNFIAQNYDSDDSECFVVGVTALADNATTTASVSWREIY